jgi:hypothetical protein
MSIGGERIVGSPSLSVCIKRTTKRKWGSAGEIAKPDRCMCFVLLINIGRATFLTPSIPLNIMTFPVSVSGFLVFSPKLLPARAWLLMRCQFFGDRSAIFMNSESGLKIMI